MDIVVEETPLEIPVPKPTPMQLSPPAAGEEIRVLNSADAALALPPLRLQPPDWDVRMD